MLVLRRALRAPRAHPSLARSYPDASLSTSAGPSSSPSTGSVAEEMAEIRRLMETVTPVNSKSQKETLLRTQFPHLKDLLLQVYDPSLKHYTTSASVRKALSPAQASGTPSRPYPTLSALFSALSTRKANAGAAAAFARAHALADDPQALDAFLRLVDKNLKLGCAANTLRSAFEHSYRTIPPAPSLASSPAQPQPQSQANDTEKQPAQSESDPQFIDRGGWAFSTALGKTVLTPNLGWTLFAPSKPKSAAAPARWYASRKLDGVRCILFLDVFFPVSPSSSPRIVSFRAFSRNGNEFTSLSALHTALRPLAESPLLRALFPGAEGSGQVHRLVLDGEVCCLLSDGETEHFASVVSAVRKKDVPMPLGSFTFHLLDVLTLEEFAGRAQSPSFGARVEERGEAVLGWLDREGSGEGKGVVRRVEQMVVLGEEDALRTVEEAARRKWEGIVFRRDKPYVGKRSTDVLKWKQWLDAEYTVKSLDTARMRLAVNGVFDEHEACANVWIEHKGTPVSVGSGFTVAQRLRYAKDPSLIIGKQITIEYFEESESAARGEGGGTSLRFPRVKMVHEGGRRDY